MNGQISFLVDFSFIKILKLIPLENCVTIIYSTFLLYKWQFSGTQLPLSLGLKWGKFLPRLRLFTFFISHQHS